MLHNGRCFRNHRQPTSSTRRVARRILRRGIATVELAVVLPILLVLVLGCVEVCQRLFLRQSAVLATYEGARLAARKTSSPQDVIARCQQVLADRRIVGAEVIVTPASFDEVTIGSYITVEVRVPWAANSATRFVLKDQGMVNVHAAMLRE